MCDNDNVDIDGAPSVMGGVWEYQAPEIVLRQTGPTRATDLHSLAVMLFRILHIGHPLVGQRALQFSNLSDFSTIRSLFGTDPLFVFDPHDASNRPIPEEQSLLLAYWALYPSFLKDMFTRAFTDGLREPKHGRVQETEWRLTMARLRDSVITCTCRAENFYDRQRVGAAATPTFSCWYCGSALPVVPPRIGIHATHEGPQRPPRHVVVCWTREPVCWRITARAGRIRSMLPPRKWRGQPGSLSLSNASRAEWTCRYKDEVTRVAPGARLLLKDGMQIQFGATRGEIRM
ncbi:MAG: hypothetical protein WDO68_06225 [Gammaproteobacteria bacterium]